MTESILTFLQSLEPKRRSLGSDSRDAYGFAVRPQHTHTYRQYIDIYKKEENERSKTWKIFLRQLAKHTDPGLYEGETKETSHVEAIEAKEADENGHEVTSGSEATELKEEVASEEQYKEASLRTSERSKGGDASSVDPDSAGSSQSEKEKEVQLAEETKICKFERWAKARPAICAIENMMVSRVKKRKSMKSMNTNESGDHLSLIKEARSSDRESDHEFEEKVCVNEMPSREESNAGNEGSSQEPHFPWKQELESLVLGGVPKDLRGQIWQAFVGVKARRVERYYKDLLAREDYDDDDDQHSNSSGMFRRWRKQIEKDLPRIFPGHPALNDSGRDSLRRLLLAYARHNPSIGYCQAMNFFAGLLLLMMPEEDAFWTLVGIIDDYFDEYYTEEMIESQVDQLVFEELMRERFPKLAKHLDYLGVQLTWISAPWFLSIFINMLPWESVLRIWDVFLFEGNRVMLFRTALALMEFYGPALLTTKDAGDCITLLQSLAGSMFDSSQLVLTACMGFLAVTDAKLHELREKYRPDVLLVVEERTKQGRDWKDSKGLACKLYSFKHDDESLHDIKKPAEDLAEGDASKSETRSSNLKEWLSSISADSEVDSESDLQERVDRMKVVLFRLLEEKRAAVIRAEELETALVELVKEDNRRELSAKIEELEQELADLHQALADKKEQEVAVHKVLMQLEQEQTITEEGRIHAEQDAAAERITVAAIKEKYEKVMDDIAQMKKRAALAESMLEATIQSESDEARTPSSSQIQLENARRKVGNLLAFGLRWRDKSKGKLNESIESKSNSSSRDEESSTPRQV